MLEFKSIIIKEERRRSRQELSRKLLELQEHPQHRWKEEEQAEEVQEVARSFKRLLSREGRSSSRQERSRKLLGASSTFSAVRE